MKKLRFQFATLAVIAALIGCSPSRTIGKFAEKEFIQQPGLESSQIGIAIYDPTKAAFLYEHQGNKYFIPASNTKLFSLYAGLKYLGDSLVGMRYRENDTALFIEPSGDPSFLHRDYARQPVIDLLKKTKKSIYLTEANWNDDALGAGWSWADYNDDYMPERSPFPIYGNYIRWIQDSVSESFYSIPDINWPVKFSADSSKRGFYVERDWRTNTFTITEGKGRVHERDVPFITDGVGSAALLLKDTVGREVRVLHDLPPGGGPGQGGSGGGAGRRGGGGGLGQRGGLGGLENRAGLTVVYSQPVDSLFRPMMHRSDNFFAEQTLLMVSNQRLGYMSDEKIIDTLLKTDLAGLPQRPHWVDGSGLSRNDLFTPRDFVWLLDKLQHEFGLDRLKVILPTGGTGTLSSYYKDASGYIFAKTGSLNGVVALSGYLITKKGRLLLFSVLVNNSNDPAVRKKIEKLILLVREKY